MMKIYCLYEYWKERAGVLRVIPEGHLRVMFWTETPPEEDTGS